MQEKCKMIWCLEDDESIRDIVLYTLTSTGFAARGFAEPGEVWEALEEIFGEGSQLMQRAGLDEAEGRRAEAVALPDLLILDIMLPGEDGVEVLRKLKADARTEWIPVIMATAKGMEFDKVRCLEIGADDYLVKPFGMMEMVARVKAILRRLSKNAQNSEPSSEFSATNTYTYSKLKMSINEREVILEDKPLSLTFKEFELLRLFLANPRQVFTRDQIFDKIWGSDYMGETRTVDMHIKTLRQKLGDYADIIGTVRGVGYRLEVDKHDK